MTLVAVGGPSWVSIDLDTTPPVLVLDAPVRCSPPDPWVVLVKSNEDLGPASAIFTDSLGSMVRVGVERVSSRMLAIVLPSVGLSTGPGELLVQARDRACNLTQVYATVIMERPRTFNVDVFMSTGQDVMLTMDGAFEAGMGVEHGMNVELTILEITDGPDD